MEGTCYMRYALEIFFDNKTEERIMEIVNGINEQGVNNTFLSWENRPHISLAGFNDVDINMCNKLLGEFANKTKAFQTQLVSIGVFNTTNNVFLSPIVTKELIDLHHNVHDLFNFCNSTGFEYYLPNNWIPHCAIMMGQPGNNKDLCEATKYVIENHRPLIGTICEICFIEATIPIKEHTLFKFK